LFDDHADEAARGTDDAGRSRRRRRERSRERSREGESSDGSSDRWGFASAAAPAGATVAGDQVCTAHE
jgi:hypothetical protein